MTYTEPTHHLAPGHIDPESYPAPIHVGPPPPLGSPEPRRASTEALRKNPAIRNRIIAALLAAGVVFGGGAYLATANTHGATVQPVSFAGDNPFTPPVGTDNPQVAGSGATGAQDGTAPGTFATSNPPACDGAKLVADLQADPAKATAWAQVEGIQPAELPAFVKSLTPALLRADTTVTDHGYQNGQFTEAPAVLAQGTAVMVSSFGQPTVKCFNGDPLTPSTAPAPEGAVAITPAANPVSTIVFSSTDGQSQTSSPAPRPVGPPPAVVIAAQKARDAANAAARDAVALRTKSNTADAASTAASLQATKDATALSTAQSVLNGATFARDLTQSQISQLLTKLSQPLPAAIRNQLLGQLGQLNAKLPGLQQAVDNATTARDTAKTTATASAAAAAKAKQDAIDAKKKADDAQTAAETAEAKAKAAEKKAGLPSPDASKQKNAFAAQKELAKLTHDAKINNLNNKEIDHQEKTPGTIDPTVMPGGDGVTPGTQPIVPVQPTVPTVKPTIPAAKPLPTVTPGTTTGSSTTGSSTTGSGTTGSTGSASTGSSTGTSTGSSTSK